MIDRYLRQFVGQLQNGDTDRLQEPTVPERFNWVRDALQPTCSAHATMLELHDLHSSETLTYGEALERADALLNWLRREGVAQGDVVYVMCGLHAGLWVAYLACIKGGLLIVPCAHVLTPEDVEYRFSLQPPRVAIGDSTTLSRLQAAPLLLSVEDLPGLPGPAAAADTHRDEPLFVFFTSGTTGMPKRVIHTHSSYPLGHLSTAAWIGLVPGDRHCNIAQPGWAKFAWSSLFAPLTVGATVFCYRQPGRFEAASLLKVLERGATTLCAPPTAWRLLIQENLKTFRLSLRECVSAGEPLNPEVIQAWREGTGLTLRDGYGQTETTCMIANLPGKPVKPGSMGKPLFLYDVLLCDESGRELGQLEEGQLAVRLGPGLRGVFAGYADRPGPEQLYFTGDKAYRDEDGYFWFVGRDDDVIKTSDYRVGPFEVESVLLEVPEVLESAVVGLPHPIRGAEVKAFVVARDPSEALAQRIFAHCRQRLAGYKRPRLLEFVEELPKTISGKIRRVELRSAPSGLEYREHGL